MMPRAHKEALIAFFIGWMLNRLGWFHVPSDITDSIDSVVAVFLCVSVGLLILAYVFDGMARLKARLRGLFGKRAV
jgi:hypothetical protein